MTRRRRKQTAAAFGNSPRPFECPKWGAWPSKCECHLNGCFPSLAAQKPSGRKPPPSRPIPILKPSMPGRIHSGRSGAVTRLSGSGQQTAESCRSALAWSSNVCLSVYDQKGLPLIGYRPECDVGSTPRMTIVSGELLVCPQAAQPRRPRSWAHSARSAALAHA